MSNDYSHWDIINGVRRRRASPIGLSSIDSFDENAVLIATYAYDGMYRRTTKAIGAETRSYYYNDQWKCVEERSTGSPSSSSSSSANANSSSSSSNANSPSSSGSSLVVVTSGEAEIQYVWGARPNHHDELILRDRDTSGNSVLDERLYCLMDYYDPTSILDTNGDVVERYRFSAFGVRTIFSPTWAEQSASSFDFDFGFHGQFLEVESGYYDYGFRYYSPELGRWVNRDPIEEEGGENIYGFVGSNGIGAFDALGLKILSKCSLKDYFTKQGIAITETRVTDQNFGETFLYTAHDGDGILRKMVSNIYRTFVFIAETSEQTADQVSKNVAARRAVINTAKSMNKVHFGPDKLNQQFWEYKKTWVPKPNLKSQAFEDLLRNPETYSFQCGVAVQIALQSVTKIGSHLDTQSMIGYPAMWGL